MLTDWKLYEQTGAKARCSAGRRMAEVRRTFKISREGFPCWRWNPLNHPAVVETEWSVIFYTPLLSSVFTFSPAHSVFRFPSLFPYLCNRVESGCLLFPPLPSALSVSLFAFLRQNRINSKWRCKWALTPRRRTVHWHACKHTHAHTQTAGQNVCGAVSLLTARLTGPDWNRSPSYHTRTLKRTALKEFVHTLMYCTSSTVCNYIVILATLVTHLHRYIRIQCIMCLVWKSISHVYMVITFNWADLCYLAESFYQCNAIRWNMIRLDMIWYHAIRYHAIRYDTIQYDTIRCNVMWSDIIPYITAR